MCWSRSDILGSLSWLSSAPRINKWAKTFISDIVGDSCEVILSLLISILLLIPLVWKQKPLRLWKLLKVVNEIKGPIEDTVFHVVFQGSQSKVVACLKGPKMLREENSIYPCKYNGKVSFGSCVVKSIAWGNQWTNPAITSKTAPIHNT